MPISFNLIAFLRNTRQTDTIPFCSEVHKPHFSKHSYWAQDVYVGLNIHLLSDWISWIYHWNEYNLLMFKEQYTLWSIVFYIKAP